MKKILFILFVLLSIKGVAQSPEVIYGDYSYPGSVFFQKGLYIPVRDTIGFAPTRVGAIVIRPQDTVGHPAGPPVRMWNGNYWGTIGGGAGSIYFSNNGIHLSGNTFQLGDSLLQATNIKTKGYDFTLNNGVKGATLFRLSDSKQQLGFTELDSSFSGYQYIPNGKQGEFIFYSKGVPVGTLKQGSIELNDSSFNNYLSASKDFFNLTGATGAAYAQIAPGSTTLSTSSGNPYAILNNTYVQVPSLANADTTKYLTTDATGKLILHVPPGTNIYNSDGQLTGNRVLNGKGHSLYLDTLGNFRILGSGSMVLQHLSTGAGLGADGSGGITLIGGNYVGSGSGGVVIDPGMLNSNIRLNTSRTNGTGVIITGLQNSISEDSILSTDTNGKLKLVKLRALDSLRYDPSTGIFYGRYTTGGELPVQISGFIKDSLQNDTVHNWSLHGPAISYPVTKVDDSHTFNIGGDTLINIFRYDPAQNHVSNSDSVMKRYSYDGGVNWTTPKKIYATDSVDGNQESGLLDNGVIVVFLRRYDVNNLAGTANIGYIRSIDKGLTWSAFTQISTTINPAVSGPFGKIVKCDSGKFIALIYALGYAEIWETNNNGATWTQRGIAYDYRVSNPERQLTEPFITHTGGGNMIIMARDNALGGPFYQLNSVDDGNTFAWQGRTNVGSDSTAKVAPCIMYDSKNNLLFTILTQRHVDNSSNSFQYNTKNDSVIVFINRPDEVFTTPTNYRPITSFARPEPDILSMYGYADLVQLQNGDWSCIFTERMSNNPGEKSHFWQFDLKNVIANTSNVPRFTNLIRRYNNITGLDDFLSYNTQEQISTRIDSVSTPRGNGVFKLFTPGWGGNIMQMYSKTGTLYHTFGPTGRVLLNSATDDATNTLQITGGLRISGQLKMQGGAPAANTVMQGDASGTGSWTIFSTLGIQNQNTSPQTANSWITGTHIANAFISRDTATDVFYLRNTAGQNRWAIGSTGTNFDMRISLFDNSGNRATIARFSRLTGQAGFGYGVSPSLVPLYVFSNNGVNDQGLSDLMFGAGTQTSFASGVGATIGIGGMYSADSSAWFGAIKAGKANATSGSRSGFISFFTPQTSGVFTERVRIDSVGNIGIGTTSPVYRLDVSGTTGQINARYAGRVIIDNAINSNEALAKGQYDAGLSTTVKNNAASQNVLTPFTVVGNGTGNANISILRFTDSDGTTQRFAIGDGSSGEQDIYLSAITGQLKMQTGGSTRMTITTTGDVVITGSMQIGAVKWLTGTGSPEGAITAPVGSLFSRTDGGAGTSLYVKESGTGNTGWVAK